MYIEGVYQLGEETEAAKFNKVPGQASTKDINGRWFNSRLDDITTSERASSNFYLGMELGYNYKNWNFESSATGSQGK